MRVLLSGATGFIGRALIPMLYREGHSVVAWVRSAERARSSLGAEVELLDARAGFGALVQGMSRSDAVVNLAGEPLIGRRWTAERRGVLRESRVGVTEQLVRAIAAASPRPRVLISGSAVGFYGDRENEPLDESTSPGQDFLAQLCQAWEAAAQRAGDEGLRVVLLRTGVVLGREGGALARMLPPFQFGVGGPIGSGRQCFPWIHLHDLVAIIARALVDNRYYGPINGVAPHLVTNREFTVALGRALRRPAILPAPAFALRAAFGEAATVLLASQRVASPVLEDRRFAFAYPTLETALTDLLAGADVRIARLTRVPEAESEISRRYLARRPPVYELLTSTILNAPLDETFAFFSKAENLGLITPASMRFSIQGPTPTLAEGTTIEHRVHVGGIPLNWRTRIAAWEPGRRFVDIQEAGPYRSWWHEHSFRADGMRTVMTDRVCYAPPLGPLGRLANRLVIVPALRRIFRYRGDVIRLRFGHRLS